MASSPSGSSSRGGSGGVDERGIRFDAETAAGPRLLVGYAKTHVALRKIGAGELLGEAAFFTEVPQLDAVR